MPTCIFRVTCLSCEESWNSPVWSPGHGFDLRSSHTCEKHMTKPRTIKQDMPEVPRTVKVKPRKEALQARKKPNKEGGG